MHYRGKSGSNRHAVRTKRRKWPWLLLLLLVIVVLAVAAIPMWVSSRSGRDFIVRQVNESTGGVLAIGDLSAGWLRGIDVANLSFVDAEGNTSVRIERISTQPDYSSLLRGRLGLNKTIITRPEIDAIIRESRPQVEREPGSAFEGPLPVRSLELTVNDGDVRVRPATNSFRAVHLSNIAAKVNIRPGDVISDFSMAMNVVSDDSAGEISAAGSAQGIANKEWRWGDMTGDVNIQVRELDLGSLRGLLAAVDVALETDGIVDGTIVAAVADGQLSSVSANLQGANLLVGGSMFDGDMIRTSGLNIAAKVLRQDNILNMSELRIVADWLQVTAQGSFPTTATSLEEILSPDSLHNLQARFTFDVAAVMSMMPNALRLQEGMQVRSGTLAGEVSLFVEEGRRVLAADAALEQLGGVIDGREVAISEPLQARGRLTRDAAAVVMLEEAAVRGGFGSITASGPLDELAYRTSINIAALQSEVGQFVDMSGYALGGRLEGNGIVTIGEEVYASAGETVISDLVIEIDGRQTAEPRLALSHDVRYDGRAEQLTLNNVNISADAGTVAVTGGVLAMETGRSNLPARIDMDLGKLDRTVTLFADMPADMQLQGQLTGDVLVTGTSDVWRIVTDNTRLVNLLVAWPGEQPLRQNQVTLAFDGSFDTVEMTRNIRRFDLVSDSIVANAAFEHSTREGTSSIQGRLEAQYDLAAVTSLARGFLPEGLELRGSRSQQATFSSAYPTDQPEAMLANLNARTNVGFDRAQYMGLNAGPTEIDVVVTNGVLTIPPFQTSVNRGLVRFQGRADLRARPAILVLTEPTAVVEAVRLDDVVAARLMQYVNPVFAGALGVEGIANLACRELRLPIIGGDSSDITIVGQVAVSELTMRAGSLLGQIIQLAGGRQAIGMTLQPAQFTLRDGLVTYDRMTLTVDNKPIEFSGSIGLDKRLDMRVTFPLGGTGQNVTLPLGGTIDAPNLRTERLLEESLREGLRRGLGDIFR